VVVPTVSTALPSAPPDGGVEQVADAPGRYNIFPGATLAYLDANYGVCGEGEVVFPVLLARFQRGQDVVGLPGLYARGGLPKDGSWKLKYQERILAAGVVEKFDASAWHSMKLVLRGTTICGYIDGKRLADVKDSSRSHGMPYLASTYDGNLFDNVTISSETAALSATGNVPGAP